MLPVVSNDPYDGLDGRSCVSKGAKIVLKGVGGIDTDLVAVMFVEALCESVGVSCAVLVGVTDIGASIGLRSVRRC